MEPFVELPEELILLDVDADSKERLFSKVAAHLGAYGYVQDELEVEDLLNEREQVMSTGIGEGVAFPHAELENLNDRVGVVVRLKKPIKFGALDRKPVDVVFFLITPKESHELILETLAVLARIIRNTSFLNRLRAAQDEREVKRILDACRRT